MMKQSLIRLTLLLALGALPLTASAQNKNPQPTAPATQPPAGGLTDRDKAEQEKIYRPLLSGRFSRTREETLAALSRQASPEAMAKLSETERFIHDLQAGDWQSVARLLQAVHEGLSRRIFDKVLADFQRTTPETFLLQADVFGLANAFPHDLDENEMAQLGVLLSRAPGSSLSQAELARSLEAGLGRFGGKDLGKRVDAARLLTAAGFSGAAAKFTPLPEHAAQLTNEVRRAFVLQQTGTVKKEPPTFKAEWDTLIDALKETAPGDAQRKETLDKLFAVMIKVPEQTAENWLADTFSKNRELAAAITGNVADRVAAELKRREKDWDSRARNARLQGAAARAMMRSLPAAQTPWKEFLNVQAASWMEECNHTLDQRPLFDATEERFRSRHAHVPVEVMIQAAPDEAWRAVLEPKLALTVEYKIARLILLTENLERATDYVASIAARDNALAGQLADDYLVAWARLHDPNISDAARRRMGGPAPQSIILTRAHQRANLEKLGKLLNRLDETGLAKQTPAGIIAAFDICHSKAEVYRREDIEQVFGPVARLPERLFMELLSRMRAKLGSAWREMTVQKEALTNRSAEDVFGMIQNGYRDAVEMSKEWLAAHPEDWRVRTLAGSTLSDWAEYEFFQDTALQKDAGRFDRYTKRSAEALDFFRAAAKAYAAQVPKLATVEYSLDVYRAWFYALLGITGEDDVNLRKGVTKEDLAEIRQAIEALPGGASANHFRMFSSMLTARMDSLKPEMKYKYLSSGIQVAGQNPLAFAAETKVQYYDSLLQEVRLETRVDGPPVVRPGQEFGVILSLAHTAAIARESGGFSKYIFKQPQKAIQGKAVTQQPQHRDALEENIRTALSDFFEIRSITFVDPNAGARELEKPGWQETPLAYIHLKTRDAAVDRVPPVQMNLDFYDKEGRAVIPVKSAPLLIEVSAQGAPERPSSEMQVAQIIDGRHLAQGALTLKVTATGRGLVPDLDNVIQRGELDLPVKSANELDGGLKITEFRSNADGVFAISERSWNLELDPKPLLKGVQEKIEFEFPPPAPAAVKADYKAYQDYDLVEAQPVVTLLEGEAAKAATRPAYGPRIAAALVLLAAIAGAFIWFRRRRAPETSERARFAMPDRVDPFTVITLLRGIQNDPQARLSGDRRQALREEIATLESACFSGAGSGLSETELKRTAGRWIDEATLGNGHRTREQFAPAMAR